MKNAILTLCFAFIPGAGQMYQGYMKRGLSLALLCFASALPGMLIPPLVFGCLIVWMYSFFDTLNLRAAIGAGNPPEDDYLVHIDWYDRRVKQLLSESHKLLGWGLIATGVLAAYDQIVMQLLNNILWDGGSDSPAFRAFYLMMEQLPEVVVCVALILCGAWLVRGPRTAQRPHSPAPGEEFRDYAAPRQASAPSAPEAEEDEEALRIIQAALQPPLTEEDDHDDRNDRDDPDSAR